MRFAAAARNLCFTNRHPWPRGGPLTSQALLTETIDETQTRRKDDITLPAPLLARPARMVRRRGLRELPSFERHAVWFVPHTHAGRVLRRAAQPPLFSSQSLLLRLRRNGACRP